MNPEKEKFLYGYDPSMFPLHGIDVIEHDLPPENKYLEDIFKRTPFIELTQMPEHIYEENISENLITKMLLSPQIELLEKNKIDPFNDYNQLQNTISPNIYNKNEIKLRENSIAHKLGQIALQSAGITQPTTSNNQNFNLSQLDYLDVTATQPEDLPEMALPVLKFIERTRPHIVIGCDRGGRLFGLAVHATWQQTRQGAPFPTLDGVLHFARVSKSEDESVLQEKIDEIVAGSIRLGAQRGNEVEDGEKLRVLFVDDWVIGGGTMRLAKRLMEKHDADTHFAVMCGDGADVSGNPVQNTRVSWHDRPEEIGVNYLSVVYVDDSSHIRQKHEPVPVKSTEATKNRERIQRAAKTVKQLQRLRATARLTSSVSAS